MQFLHGYKDFSGLGEYDEQGFFASNGLSGIEVPAYTTDLLTMTNSGIAYNGYGTPAYTTDLLDASNISGGLSDYNQVPLVSGMHGLFDTIKSGVSSAAGSVKKAVVGSGKKAVKKSASDAKKQATQAATTAAKKQIKQSTGVNVSSVSAQQVSKVATSANATALKNTIQSKTAQTKKKPAKTSKPMDNPLPPQTSTDDSSMGMTIGLGVVGLALVGGAFWYMKSKKGQKTTSRKNPKSRHKK
jgi:hypothetical protein